MSHDLDAIDTGTALDVAPEVSQEDDDRPGCELIDGVWVPKHPDELPPDDDRSGCELIDGVWVEKGMSNLAAIIESNLNFVLKLHVRANRLGFVFSESARYQLFAATAKQVRRPDLSFVRSGRLPNDRVPVGKMQLAPDLAVEVISPTDIAEDVETKLDEYLRAGTRLVWLVYVPTRNVWAYKPDGTAKLYRTADTLSGDDVLLGFSVPVAELFEGV
jgi:Uma2 family endonuclease